MASTFKIKPTGKLLSDRGLSSKGRVQQFVDSEVLRLTAPYIPLKPACCKKSGTLGTVVGTGEVKLHCSLCRQTKPNCYFAILRRAAGRTIFRADEN